VLRLDHVVYAAADLDEAADRFRRHFGLDSSAGGRHPGWGTANRIVPLGAAYLELIAVVEPAAAEGSRFGRSILEAAGDGGSWVTMAASTPTIHEVAGRLGLEVVEGRRERPDGSEIRWRSAGVEDPRREPWMPFFLEWDVPPELHPGRARAGHGVRVDGIARVDVGGDAARLDDWLGGRDLPIRVLDGVPGIRAVALATEDGELVVG
jgi:hypothetical protein